jgi:hypothetical protein
MACLLSDGIYELAELTAITEITGAGFVGVANSTKVLRVDEGGTS